MDTTITTTSEARPPACGWLRGWCYLIFEGSLVGACVGVVVWDGAIGLFGVRSPFGGDIILVFFGQLLFAWPFAFVFGLLPLTILYVTTRRSLAGGRLTLGRRAAVGVLLGLLTNACVLLRFWAQLPNLFSLDAFSIILLCTLTAVQASALAAAMLARSRWFGVA